MPSDARDPIAVVGIGCRFPGAHGPQEFWRLLRSGQDAVTEIPQRRRELGGFDQAARRELAGRKGGFLTGIEEFDPGFFGIPPRDAHRMDPQQRLLLETAWEALEDAGLCPRGQAGLSGRAGVFVGQSVADYWELQQRAVQGQRTEPQAALSGIRAMLSGYLSHLLELSGPSLSVDTACSSSLVAVRLAAQSLRTGECELALAGGVNLLLAQENFLGLARHGLFAGDGRCKFADAAADGFVRGDGVGLVVLKPLRSALAARDRVYAVLLGGALNNDGGRGGALGRPAAPGQSEVLRAAYLDAGVAAAEVDYVEAHGAGTAVGDPVELAALGEVLGAGRPAARALRVGSVKTNLGHTEAAAGIAGLIKAALCLHHARIPPSLHLHEPNPAIDWAGLPLTVPTTAEPLPERDRPHLAGVSSFGISGTNVHLVLAEAPRAAHPPEPPGPVVLTLSAHTPAALRALACAYPEYLERGEFALADLCHTAAVRRGHHPHRLAVLGNSAGELAARLRGFLAGDPGPGTVAGQATAPPRVAFVFPGQGAQWAGMGHELLETEPVFRDSLARCDRAVRAETGWSVLERLHGPAEGDPVQVLQPTLWAVQVALAALWRSWGIEPDAVLGHSMGEVAAACVAGALGVSEAAAVICRRSALAARLAGRGGMLSVALPAEAAAAAIAGRTGRVAVAVSNAPSATVLSGDRTALAEVAAELTERGVSCRWIEVTFAAHSPQVDELSGELRQRLAGLRARPPRITFQSTVPGGPPAGLLDAGYWVRNLREPVRFGDGAGRLLRAGITVFLELSPHPILLPAVAECAEAEGRPVTALPSLRRTEPEREGLLGSLAALHVRGCPVRWRRVYPGGRVVSLPPYRWDRGRYWITPQPRPAPGHPLLGTPVDTAGTERCWEGRLDWERNGYLADHRVREAIVFPGSGYCELAVAAVRELTGARAITITGVRLRTALLLRAGESPLLRVRLVPRPGSGWRVEILSNQDGGWVTHASGTARADAARPPAGESPAEVRARCREKLSGPGLYRRIGAGGNEWRERFQGVAEVWCGRGEALARVVCPESLRAELAGFHLHPAVLDACGQALAAAAGEPRGPLVLGGTREARIHGSLGERLWSHAVLTGRGPDGSPRGDLRVLDEAGNCVLELHGTSARYLRPGTPELYELRWERARGMRERRPETQGTWLVLPDAGGVGQRLRELLLAGGEDCLLAGPEVDPAGLALADAPIRGVVYLACLDLRADSPVPEALELGCGTVLRLVRALRGVRTRLWLVTCGAQPAGLPVRTPLAAPLWGLGRVLAQEHPCLRPTLVDLDERAPAAAAAALHRQLRAAGEENQLALRGPERYVARLARYRPPERAPETAGPSGGSYLVTGGLGGIGRRVAAWLAGRGARHLVLTGRSAGQAPELAGARVHYARVDVADEPAMRALLAGLRRRGWPPVRGVFHAAGVVEFALAEAIDPARLPELTRAKIAGALVLHRLFPGTELAEFVLFSSVAAVLHLPAMGSYAAGNAFLDALAHYRRARGEVATTVNWGVWHSVGMAARAGHSSRPALPEGMSGFAPEQGLALLERVLREGPAQVAAFTADWARVRAAHPAEARLPVLRELVPAGPEPAAAGEPERPVGRAAVTAYLVRQLAAVLELPPERIDQDTPLHRMGLGSLSALELRNRVTAALGVTLPVTQLLGGHSVAQLTETVLAEPTRAGGP
ncbi:type I polyketide synthase [Amycolatopsis aidingensis]|uniref:type I polyketide synthase n=1 Tax=Amycolatopsis aidingensis TaxID=2842453 RepID=UPI001C0CBD7A|nr:type I polyketide synthase [Amycolatopsis aidingensis]